MSPLAPRAPSASAPPADAPQALLPEDAARADWYGLLAALWLAPPDAALRQAVATAARQAAGASTPHADAPTSGAAGADAGDAAGDPQLPAALARLASALQGCDDATAAAEHAALFLGVGRPEIAAFASFHLAGTLHGEPLVALRDELAGFGLTREAGRSETEDHVAGVFGVMRWLALRGSDEASLARQAGFFERHVGSWAPLLCAATVAHPRARLWADIARLTQAFVAVESQAFAWFREGGR